MNAQECIRTRRSVRSFTQQPVPWELVAEAVADAACAPSWKNTQIARYTLITDPALLGDIAGRGTMGFEWNSRIIAGAPALVVLSYVRGRSGFEKDGSFSTDKGPGWQMFDAGIAAQTFCLAAWDRGLGTVIMGIYDSACIAQLIGLPEEQEVAALIAVGYPADAPAMPARKPAEQLLRVVKK